jgi:hypothetical protein
MSSENECPICLDIIINNNESNIYITICNHNFHKKCWNEYIDYNKSKKKIFCPLCNKLLIERNINSQEDTPVVIIVNYHPTNYELNNILIRKKIKFMGIATICAVLLCGGISLYKLL